MVEDHFPTLRVGSGACGCPEPSHELRLVVVTGGPDAGKTAVLELAARSFCEHVAILPEAATIVFGGGFPRHDTLVGLRGTEGNLRGARSPPWAGVGPAGPVLLGPDWDEGSRRSCPTVRSISGSRQDGS